MRIQFTSITAAVALALLLFSAPVATPRAQEPELPALPLRLSAFAVNMSTVQAGRNTAVIDLRITRWSTPAEREKLINIAVEKGQDALLRELQRMPNHGKISIPGWQGPDPHNARLGWTLHYAFATPGEDGGVRIGIATDRYIGFWEARNSPRTIDYPFTLIELRIGADGRGEGKMSLATKIIVEKKKNTIVLEDYKSQPVLLTNLKREATSL